ncbi:CBS domain-containing protein [Pyrofollis japonicus]|uniref:CBS domain-containing protein n=1 Tax=Pyrofollis japonicus TaxID=3060460 RepID=UPI00295B115E|nr:CBS domain-containing protein [Pyrofollis japonicus]
MAGKPVPRDILFFLAEEVFPHLPRKTLEEVLTCSSITLLSEGEKVEKPGLYIVYNGSIRVGDASYHRGDYFVVEGSVSAEAESESIVVRVRPECVNLLISTAEVEACRVEDLVYRAPVTVVRGTPVVNAVRTMYENGVSSVIVVDEELRPEGIFTDTDLRRLVALGENLSKPVDEFMTPNPIGVPPSTACTDAVYLMMERNIKHLLVKGRGDKLLGVVTIRDIAYAEALGPLYARRIVRTASSLDELRDAYARLTRMLSRFNKQLHPLLSRGGVVTLVKMASLVLRSVIEKAAELAAKQLGVGPKDWAYIVMGSNARLEQMAPTDRDTALIYSGSVPESKARELAETIEDFLDKIGFPGCSHGYTARRLLYSLEEAKERLRRAATSPKGDEEVVTIGLFMDAAQAYPRQQGGDHGEELRKHLFSAISEAGSAPYLRSVLAAYRPRLRALGRLPRRIDLKKDGLAPIVFAVKALVVSANIWRPVSTVERLEELAAKAVLSPSMAAEAAEAYRILLGFTAWSIAVHGSREIDVDELSGVERSLLRSALQAASRLVDRARTGA